MSEAKVTFLATRSSQGDLQIHRRAGVEEFTTVAHRTEGCALATVPVVRKATDLSSLR